jgi:opacity protein-like surface antigen
MSKTLLKASVLLGFLALIIIPSPAGAQGEKYNYNDDEGPGFNSGTRLILGYAANIPNQYVGFTLGFTRPRTWGLFLDYKMNTTSLEIAPYLYDYTPEYVDTTYWSDTLIDHNNSWISVNAGLTRPINDRFCAYLGLGISFRKAYLQYYEPQGNNGDNGYYWINDDANSTVNLNVTGGVYYKLGRYFYLQLGGDIKPLGLAAGLGLSL